MINQLIRIINHVMLSLRTRINLQWISFDRWTWLAKNLCSHLNLRSWLRIIDIWNYALLTKLLPCFGQYLVVDGGAKWISRLWYWVLAGETRWILTSWVGIGFRLHLDEVLMLNRHLIRALTDEMRTDALKHVGLDIGRARDLGRRILSHVIQIVAAIRCLEILMCKALCSLWHSILIFQVIYIISSAFSIALTICFVLNKSRFLRLFE